ncbi:tigger transposable element-derived protein 1-like isoform 1-T10 [Molossus nigricans]
MAPKRAASSKPSDDETKRRRKMLTIQEKVKLLDMIKDGKKIVEVARHYNLNESTVRSIRKDEKNIRATATVSFNKEAKRVMTSRNKFIVKTESALAVWISDSRKKNIPLDSLVIREKARQLYQRFTEDEPQPGPSSATFMDFTASKGWFEKFQKRYHLKSVVLHGEAASADQPAAEDCVNNTFQKILEEGEYHPEQVFNMDETRLFWKRMPSRTFIFKDEAKVRVSEEEEEQPEVPGGQEEEVGLTLERLSQVVRTIKVVQDVIGKWDPQMMRALRFRNALDGAIEPYKSLLTHMKRQRQQLPITMFFSRAPRHPLPTPSAPSVEDDDVPAEDTSPPEDSSIEVVPSEEQ